MLLDIGLGIIWGILFDMGVGGHSLATYVWFGIFAALSPDLDFIYHLVRGGNMHNDHRHREVLHQPLFLLLGLLLFGFLFSWSLGWLFVVGALGHFIHDSIGIGWGVQWFAPLKTDHYTFLYRVHTADKPAPPKKMIYVWPNKDIDKLNKQYGDDDWFRNTYIKWHPFAIVELAVFVLSLIVLWQYTS